VFQSHARTQTQTHAHTHRFTHGHARACAHSRAHMTIETDRQTDRQTDRHTDRHTDAHTDTHTHNTLTHNSNAQVMAYQGLSMGSKKKKKSNGPSAGPPPPPPPHPFLSVLSRTVRCEYGTQDCESYVYAHRKCVSQIKDMTPHRTVCMHRGQESFIYGT